MVYFFILLKEKVVHIPECSSFCSYFYHRFSVLVHTSIRLQTQQAIERQIHMIRTIFFLNSGPLRLFSLLLLGLCRFRYMPIQGMAPLQVWVVYEV